MNRFQEVLADVFEREAEDRLDVETERDLIALAKEGDEEAFLALVYAYAPALRNAVKRYRQANNGSVSWEEMGGGPAHAADELRQTAALGLMEAVRSFDLSGEHVRLGAVLPAYLSEALSSSLADAASGFTVPSRTLKRFFSILRKAGGNVEEALVIAPDYLMARDTFLAVLEAVRFWDSLEAGIESGLGGEAGPDASAIVAARPVADAEDRLLVAQAFRAVDDVEAVICRMAYGFTDYGDVVHDPEIGYRLGMPKPTVQRKRVKALGKMREALGVEGLA